MSDLMVRSAEAGGAAPAAVPDDEHEFTRRIEFILESLQSRFGPTVEPARIRAEVEAEFAAYSAARVRDFIPILVESRVRSRLLRPPSR